MSSTLKILYLGDIVGHPGRDFIASRLQSMKNANDIDIIIANGENATSGSGITRAHAESLHSSGVDLITLGDHVWDRQGFERDIDSLEYVCRPANLPEKCPGRDFIVVEKNGAKVGVCAVLGRNFMKIFGGCPISALERVMQKNRAGVDIFIAEVHAEATSEKIALGWFLDGKVSAIVGTHTHVQTADERILPKGSGYITDLGMCGAHESVIGREISPVLYSMRFGMPQKLEIATKDVRLNGVILTIDCFSGLCKKISRFSEKIS
jgi:metallophosphoesterase (TIGR00282 family)